MMINTTINENPIDWLEKILINLDQNSLDYEQTYKLAFQQAKDMKKNMWYERNVQNPYPSDSPSHTGFDKGFELGYNQALEDNKDKKYTEEDMIRAYTEGENVRYSRVGKAVLKEQFIQSLKSES